MARKYGLAARWAEPDAITPCDVLRRMPSAEYGTEINPTLDDGTSMLFRLLAHASYSVERRDPRMRPSPDTWESVLARVTSPYLNPSLFFLAQV